jgi:hypothetical protein
MDKIVAFDQSQSLDDFMPAPKINRVRTSGSNGVVTFRGISAKKLSDFNAKRGFVVRSEGGRICCDFNDLHEPSKE